MQCLILTTVTITVTLTLAACTGAVAPEGTPESKSRVAAMEKKSAELKNIGGDGGSPTPTPAETDPPDDEPTADDSVVIPTGDPLGTITDESGDIFKAASVYGVYNGSGTYKSLIITVTENAEQDLKFKKVIAWTCYTCKENDPRCVETTLTDGSYYLTFTKPSAEPAAGSGVTAAANSNGFPNKTPIVQTGISDDDAFFNIGFSISLRSAPSLSGHKGTVTFTTMPAAVGDSFVMTTALQFGNSKTHNAKLTGKVFEAPTGSLDKPTGCDAANGKFAVPTYE